MGRTFRAIIVGACCVLGIFAVNGQAGNDGKAEKKAMKKTKEIKDLKKEAGKKNINDVKVRDEKGAIWTNGVSPQSPYAVLDSTLNYHDPGRQSQGGQTPNNPSGSIISNFNGLPYTNIVPPDPTMAVGPNHILQMLNGTSGSMFMVTNKSGTVLIPATFMDQVTGIGGFADPIALYDHLADRFLMMEMVNVNEAGSYGISIALSKTPDPTGAWDVFFLSTGSNLPDYPKLAMWPDAYYLTANEFSNASSYAGTYAYAMDRNAMLQAQASPQTIRIRLGLQSKHVSACPVTLQGSPSGSASNGLIAWMADDVWSTWDETDVDSVGLFKFTVNWSNPALSVISNVASLATVPYKSNVCTATRGRCITQTGTTTMLEALHQKIMNQPVYRAFEGFEGIVMTHTTDAGNEQAGVRWYELKKTAVNPNWVIGQQSTWSPDGTHRFMPTISYNYRGDIGLAYNVSDGSGVYPGIRFTGRRSCDPAGQMTVPETTIMDGNSYNVNSRFGDYNHMVADPVNGNFWVTAEYMPNFQWASRIAQLKIDTCTQVCDVPTNLYTKNLGPTYATLAWTHANGINFYELEYKAAMGTEWIALGNTTADSLNLSNLAQGESYTWRIKSHCNLGNSLWVGGSFSTPQKVFDVPANTSTTLITYSSARFKWSKNAEAIDYQLEYQVFGESAWTDLPVTVADTQYNINGLMPLTTYSWRVRAIYSPNVPSNWATQVFTTLEQVCNAPTGLNTTNITITSAKFGWTRVADAIDYVLEYQSNGAADWIDIPVTAADTIYILSGLTPATGYNWRVKSVCSATLASNWATQAFATPAEICLPPTGLQTTLITSSSAKLSWVPVSGNLGQNLEYQASGDSSWISLPISPTTAQYSLGNLTPLKSYSWRVRTNCTTLQSMWVGQTFATTAQLCQSPALLTASDFTSGSAQLDWSAVNGAISYRVEYQKAGATTWTLLTATATTNTAYLSGLSASTAYNWRVSATCPQNTTGFSQASFTTTGSCSTPSNPVTSNISSSGATLGWSSVKGSKGYRVEYKTAAATNWIVMPNTTSTSTVLTGLQPLTGYQWRVRTICTAGTSAPSATLSFTTFGPPCPDPYEPNNSNKALAPIPVNTDISASIGTGTDQDWYSFYNTTAQPNMRITLSQMPANYSMTLYSPSGKSLVKSAKTGLADEVISYNTTTIGKYWIQIFPASSSGFDPSKCYRLRVNIQSGTNTPEGDYLDSSIIYTDEPPSTAEMDKPLQIAEPGKLLIYPNPAKDRIFVQFGNNGQGKTTAIITDQAGRQVQQKILSGLSGESIDISRLPAGIYLLQLKSGNQTQVQKFMVGR